MTSKHKEALLKSEEKQQQAMNKDRDAEYDKERADKRVKLVEEICREDEINAAERGKEREYKRVVKIGELLMAYKKESANLQYLARDLRDDEGQLTEMCTSKENDAERAHKKANIAEEEVIEAEFSSYEANQKSK